MKKDLNDRLNTILQRLESKDFLENSAPGNDIDFYIFDYPPEEELKVREHIKSILIQLAKRRPDLLVKHVNLFELIVNHLKDRNLLNRALQMQTEKGDQALRKALSGPMHEEKIAKVFVDVVKPAECDLVIMSGIGSVWPLLRSHTLLNNLHPVMQGIPLVVFYPGVYDGQGLKLFGRLSDKNYYRAFSLVP